jgi:hypothetical protein
MVATRFTQQPRFSEDPGLNQSPIEEAQMKYEAVSLEQRSPYHSSLILHTVDDHDILLVQLKKLQPPAHW